MFTIECDAARSFIHAKMWGFLEVIEVDEFFRQEQQAVRDMRCRSGDFVLLVDSQDAVIQSQDVVNAFIEHILKMRLRARRVAVVRGNSLARMQAQRILQVRDDAAIFATLADAEAWLFGASGDDRLRA